MSQASEYENFICGICADLGEPAGIIVHRNKSFPGRISGRDIKVDVSFEGKLLGARILGIVECKRYSSRVEVSDVEEFHSKLDDIGAHKGIMFTTVGYEDGAKKVAQGRGIALFILQEGQMPDELITVTKSASSSKTSKFLRGLLLPMGQSLDIGNDIGIYVESADKFYYFLALSDAKKYGEIADKQKR